MNISESTAPTEGRPSAQVRQAIDAFAEALPSDKGLGVLFDRLTDAIWQDWPKSPLAQDIEITRLWRAHVSSADWRKSEVTAFIEAGNATAAAKKIATVIATLEYRKPEDVEERIYNVASADELTAEGLSDDHAVRLFECGWCGGKATHFVEHPLVLVANPGPLLAAWARIPRPSTGGAIRDAQDAPVSRRKETEDPS